MGFACLWVRCEMVMLRRSCNDDIRQVYVVVIPGMERGAKISYDR